MSIYSDDFARSVSEPEAFWAEQARLIAWHREPQTLCDLSQPPFTRWFAGGLTNLCHNAVDRHAATRGEQAALVWISSETGQERRISYTELQREVQRVAAALRAQGVGKGDRVLLYLPMVPEAVFAMLATVRLGAIHSVVFGGFAAHALAARIDDARPKLIVSADAGLRAGKCLPYQPLLEAALGLSAHQPQAVWWVDRALAPLALRPDRDRLWSSECGAHDGAEVPCEWVDATHPSYILYTSGTTGRPKGVQRDTGGYAVALAASMQQVFGTGAGEAFFSTSDIGWVVGHSYIVYGPLLAGATTVMYEGVPTRPDPGVWWRIVQEHKVVALFTAPTAARVLRREGAAWLERYDLSSLRAIYLAGEAADAPTAEWLSRVSGLPVIDNYWQTETGWPVLVQAAGRDTAAEQSGGAGLPMPGWQLALFDEEHGTPVTTPGAKGVLCIRQPTPPGFMQTVWGDDARFERTYWRSIPGQDVYSTFDWAVRDEAGRYTLQGRTDDVINVAGHRLGTRELEEALASHAQVAESAVVGVQDALKGQVAHAFVVPRDADVLNSVERQLALAAQLQQTVEQRLGAIARPAQVDFVAALPKTRSGKLLRRAIQAVCEGRDPGDLSTLEDPASLRAVRESSLRGRPRPAAQETWGARAW